MTKPITPREVVKAKKTIIPEFVLEAFNEMIAKNWADGSSCFKQDDVVDLIKAKWVASGQKVNEDEIFDSHWEDEIFDSHWLDVEDVYRKAGWSVKYDSPAYCETYPATFEFKPRRKRGSGDCGFRE
jgi:hypothetical protein